MEGIFEYIDYELISAVAKRLEETLSSVQLVSCMKNFHEAFGLTHERYDSICEMLANGKIRLVDSAWSNKPEDYIVSLYNLGDKPKFINVENYKKIKELRSNKSDWDKNWREYIDRYVVSNDSCYNDISFYVGEHYARNAKIALNSYFPTDLEVKTFQFMVMVYRDNESWSRTTDLGQEYVFEFVGNNPEIDFVEAFRSTICRKLAERLVTERKKQLLEEEVVKTTSLFGTIFDKENMSNN